MKYTLRHKSSGKYYSGKIDFRIEKELALGFRDGEHILQFVQDNLEGLADVLRIEPKYKGDDGFTKWQPVYVEDFEVVEFELKEISIKELTVKENT